MCLPLADSRLRPPKNVNVEYEVSRFYPQEALSEHMEGSHGAAMFRAACAMGLEGIVSKRLDRPYQSGRSANWIKIKNPDAPAATRLIEG